MALVPKNRLEDPQCRQKGPISLQKPFYKLRKANVAPAFSCMLETVSVKDIHLYSYFSASVLDKTARRASEGRHQSLKVH